VGINKSPKLIQKIQGSDLHLRSAFANASKQQYNQAPSKAPELIQTYKQEKLIHDIKSNKHHRAWLWINFA
jgi:hypothetical protein